MKRGGPLKRKTELKAKTQLKRLTQLRPRSKKREKLYKEERVPLVEKILSARPFCELGPKFRAVDPTYDRCTFRATCVDELVKRSAGGSIVDEANCQASCWSCNIAKEDLPLLARAAGVAKRRNEVKR